MSLGITSATHEIYSEVLTSSVMAWRITHLIHVLLLVFFLLSVQDQIQTINFLEKKQPFEESKERNSIRCCISFGPYCPFGHFSTFGHIGHFDNFGNFGGILGHFCHFGRFRILGHIGRLRNFGQLCHLAFSLIMLNRTAVTPNRCFLQDTNSPDWNSVCNGHFQENEKKAPTTELNNFPSKKKFDGV